ncbi:MAG: NAD(P)-dependent oxidoreductase [Actinomycetes bacterium]
MTASARDRVVVDVPASVFVTGANGFMGRALMARLRELGAQATGVDLIADAEHGVVGGSTTDPQKWPQALEGVDAVIHTAAIVSNVASIDQAWEVNVLGTRRVLEAAATAGVSRFLHISSVAAYGTSITGVLDERFPIRVEGRSYVDSRVNSEAVVLAAHASGEIPCTIVRPGDLFGPGAVWVREPIRMLRSHQMILPAGGKGIFSPTYIDNLVDGVLLALSSEAGVGQIFNITDDVSMTCEEFFGALATFAGGSVRTIPTSLAVPLGELLGTATRAVGWHSEANRASVLYLARQGTFSIEKARRLLGYEPRVSFAEGMARVQAWAHEEGVI